ncbi:MAG: YjbQ family protein, partial [Gaiellaceae bacterium]
MVRDAVAGQSGAAALVYVPHTTAGVTINEHADPAV